MPARTVLRAQERVLRKARLTIKFSYKRKKKLQTQNKKKGEEGWEGENQLGYTARLRFLPEVREFIRDTKPRTNTTRGGRRARTCAVM